MTQTLHHGKSTEKNFSFVCETKLFVILSYIQIHSILYRIIFLFCILNTPITLFVTILYKCQLPLVIPLLWFGQSMQWGYIPFFFLVSCPLKNQRQGLNSFWDKDWSDRYSYLLCSCVMKSKQNSNLDRQSKV